MGAGAGVFQSFCVTMNQGLLLSGADLSPEGVAEAWPRIADRSTDTPFSNGVEQPMQAMALLQEAAEGG